MMGAAMGELVNLKRFKKRSEREQAAKQAHTNRARFGRTKSERARDESQTNRANDHLDQHRIDGEDAS
jgi:ribosomal protein S21